MGFLPTRTGSRVFISWVRHTTRSASLARGLGAENFFIDSGASMGPFKYVPRALRTLSVLVSLRPGAVFCMNPPYFAGMTAWLYCLVFRARFALDSHTAAFDQPEWLRLEFLHRFLVRRAACSTVTNAELARRVEAMGGRAVVVSDIPYDLPDGTYDVDPDRFTVCFCCTYANDEPILEVFEAARKLPDVRVYVTGNDKKATDEVRRAKPGNVTFTGYLSNEAYAGLLRGVSAILVLTTRNFTMQRGGSEAITVGKPLITSDWPVLREIFSLGTVHVNNTAVGIQAGIEEVRRNYDRYMSEIGELKEVRERRWQTAKQELEGLLA
jgi:glycosyltransferase involved in cell wall biosynthesis